MSHQYHDICSECGSETFEVYQDSDSMDGFCKECGYKYWTERGQADLAEVNEYRKESGLEPLTELRTQFVNDDDDDDDV